MSKQASDKMLILSIVAAAIIIAAAIVFVSLRHNSSISSPALAPYAEQVMIQDSLKACASADSCIVVDTTCSFCCKYVAINAKHEKLYNELFDSSCQSYKGEACQCFDLASYPACVNGKCQLVKWDEEKKH